MPTYSHGQKWWNSNNSKIASPSHFRPRLYFIEILLLAVVMLSILQHHHIINRLLDFEFQKRLRCKYIKDQNGGMVDDFIRTIRTSIDRVRQQFLSNSVSNLILQLLHKQSFSLQRCTGKSWQHSYTDFQSFFLFLQAKTHTHTLLHTQTFFMVPIMSEVELFPFCCLGQCRYYIYLSHSGQEILQIMPIKDIKILQKDFFIVRKIIYQKEEPLFQFWQ